MTSYADKLTAAAQQRLSRNQPQATPTDPSNSKVPAEVPSSKATPEPIASETMLAITAQLATINATQNSIVESLERLVGSDQQLIEAIHDRNVVLSKVITRSNEVARTHFDPFTDPLLLQVLNMAERIMDKMRQKAATTQPSVNAATAEPGFATPIKHALPSPPPEEEEESSKQKATTAAVPSSKLKQERKRKRDTQKTSHKRRSEEDQSNDDDDGESDASYSSGTESEEDEHETGKRKSKANTKTQPPAKKKKKATVATVKASKSTVNNDDD